MSETEYLNVVEIGRVNAAQLKKMCSIFSYKASLKEGKPPTRLNSDEKKCFELFYFISLFIFWHSGDDPSHRNLKHRTRELPLADVAESCSKLKIPFFQLNRTLKDFLIFIKYHCTPFSALYILKFKINALNFKSYFVTWVFFSVFEELTKQFPALVLCFVDFYGSSSTG